MSIEVINYKHPQLNSLLQELAQSYEGWGIYWPDVIKQNALEEGTLFGNFVEGELVAFCLVSTTENDDEYYFLEKPIPYSTLFYLKEREYGLPLAKHLKETYGIILVDWEDSFEELYQAGFKDVDIEFDRGEYHLGNINAFISESPDYIKNQLEKYWAKGEIVKITTEVKTKDVLEKDIYQGSHCPKIPAYMTPSNMGAFVGFKYFSYMDFNKNLAKDTRFIVAYSHEKIGERQRKRIVGILRVGTYGEGRSLHTAVFYIDVHWDYRRMGIATKMYQQLNDWLSPNDVLVGSIPSLEGKEANIQQVRQRNVTKCMNFNTDQDFYDFLRLIPA